MSMWSDFYGATDLFSIERISARLRGADGEFAASRGDLLALQDLVWTGDRPSHVTLSMPHPAFCAQLAERTGVSAEDLARVARYDASVIDGAVA